MKRKLNIRTIRKPGCSHYVQIHKGAPIGFNGHHTVGVRLCEADGVGLFACEGIEAPSGSVELWTTGYGNLFGRFDEQVAEIRSILSEAA